MASVFGAVLAAGAVAAISGAARSQTVNIDPALDYAHKTLLGYFAGGSQIHVTASGLVYLASSGHYPTNPDGSLAGPLNEPDVSWAAVGATNYPTFAGGDGVNHYAGGGTNWQGVQFNGVGAQSTDTTNPATIRFGALVGTFSANPEPSDWFAMGTSWFTVVPAGGAYLYAAVSDCDNQCYPDNVGSYSVTVTPVLGAGSFPLYAASNTTEPLDAGAFAGGTRLVVSFTGVVDIYDEYGYHVRPDGALDSPWTGPTIPWVNAGATDYPTFAGGDGVNHYPGGGTNWNGSLFNSAGAQSTDTTNAATVRFGTVVGSFTGGSAAGEWFPIGSSKHVIIPPAGAHLYLAVSDCPACEVDNVGYFTGTISPAPPCPADLNADGVVNTPDLAVLLGHFGKSVAAGTLGDLNNDGVVNTVDLSRLLAVFGTGCP